MIMLADSMKEVRKDRQKGRRKQEIGR